MKQLIILFISVLILACNTTQKPEQTSKDISDVPIITVNVEGMTCEGCENTIELNLKEFPEIKFAEASYKQKTVKVALDTTKLKLSVIKDKIKEVGYTVVE